jgi:predicted nucleic acid-binding protein
VNVYVDASVVLRIVLGEPAPLDTWHAITTPISSELIRLECLRTIDRARIRLALDDQTVARRRSELLEALDALKLVALDRTVLDLASEPLPTLVGSLDAIHLATARLVRQDTPDVVLATHDVALATAARATGFTVQGVVDQPDAPTVDSSPVADHRST